MLKRVKIWRGLSGLFCTLMIIVIFATSIIMSYASVINQFLGVSTSKEVRTGESDTDVDTEYYKSSFGELSAENLEKLENAAYEHNINEMEEGAVLLKNEKVGSANALPLTSTDKKITLFGSATKSPLYRTSAACTEVLKNNPELIVDLRTSLKNEGFDINEELYDAYGKIVSSRMGYSYDFEKPIDFYESKTGTWANYKDVAIVMLSREAGEGVDMVVDQTDGGKKNTGEVSNSLALQNREKAMLKLIAEQGFGKIIVLINTNYMMELDWLDDPQYKVDACLFIGMPGLKGFTGVARILSGKVNPSGALADTFTASSLSSPAIANACGNTAEYTNIATIKSDGFVDDFTTKNNYGYVSVQQENIYVGYKYYETRYADAVSGNRGNATSSVGASFGAENWNYADEMSYPFGFGLSYSTFEQEIVEVTSDTEAESFTVKVKVSNTGNVDGKTPVIVYAQTPYGDYEKTNGIEKSAIQLVGFEKSPTVKAGESVTVEVPVDEYMLASYDSKVTKGYMLSAGKYYFAVGNGAHEALNNVLAVDGVTSGLIDHDGNAFDSTNSIKRVHSFTLSDIDTTMSYTKGEDNEKITNQFDKMDINYWEPNSVKYLTRSDWAGTFPTESASVTLLAGEMAELLQGDFYKKASDCVSTSEFAQGKNNDWKGVDNGISFISMRGVEYDDEEKWNAYLDQFSLEQLGMMTANYFGNKMMPSPINFPEKSGGDGCQGVGVDTYPVKYTNGKILTSCLYTSIFACTYNKKIMENRGTLMANQAIYMNQTVIWTGGGNLHRTPYGGRQGEYYSEDANLTYIIGLIELPAMEKLGILGGYKHYAANDQETRREGVSTFYREQAFREGSLRGFEGAVRKGKIHAIMQAFNRQGVVYSSSCYELSVKVLRDEWGFKGYVITDASSGAQTGYKSHYTTSMATGTNVYCLDGNGIGGSKIVDAIKNTDDGFLLSQLRQSTKHVTYAMLHSTAINGLDPNVTIVEVTPTWQILLFSGLGIVIALAAASLVLFAISKIKTAKEVE